MTRVTFSLNFSGKLIPSTLVYYRENFKSSFQKIMLDFLLEIVCNAWREALASYLEITNTKAIYKTLHEKPTTCQI